MWRDISVNLADMLFSVSEAMDLAEVDGPITASVRVIYGLLGALLLVGGGLTLVWWRAEVLRANRGRTLYMPPPMKVRAVPAQSGRFTIAGQAMYAPSLMDATQVVQAVSGTVEFAPEAGRRYEVQGEFRDGYAAVWVEDAESHRVVTPKIERKEAAAH